MIWLWVPVILPLALMGVLLVLDALERVTGRATAARRTVLGSPTGSSRGPSGQGPEGP